MSANVNENKCNYLTVLLREWQHYSSLRKVADDDEQRKKDRKIY
jgi:hypothetical protein